MKTSGFWKVLAKYKNEPRYFVMNEDDGKFVLWLGWAYWEKEVKDETFYGIVSKLTETYLDGLSVGRSKDTDAIATLEATVNELGGGEK